eukprot:TRINITY_DN21138_c0_g1_i2.p1 TRINITY_DN21138_c0_g1~~TRINITY_DN21138_c0_g1_i2.p1  ORF type:complete len:126 (+),score=23.67 TRINITY_DN21138_c0_g1_i2:79-456(+)
MPKQLMSFTMELQTDKGDKCPPPASASKEERTHCAKWDRISSGLLSPIFNLVGSSFGTFHYYVYQIVDKSGARVQPYYDACVAHAGHNHHPDPAWAARVGLELQASKTSFVGLRSIQQSDASSEL